MSVTGRTNDKWMVTGNPAFLAASEKNYHLSAVHSSEPPAFRPEFGPQAARRIGSVLSQGVFLNQVKPQRDRRQWARLPLAIPVFVRGKDGNGKELLEFATALNVSAGGALVAVRRSLPLSSQVSLEIPSAPLLSAADLPAAARNMRARSVWTTHAEGYQLAGLKFSHALLGPRSSRETKRRKVVSSV